MPTPSETKNLPEETLSSGMLPSLIGYHIRIAQNAIFRDFAERLGEFQITPGLFGVLVIIESNPDLKQSELARATHLDRSSVVAIIDKLEKRNLVERRPALNDRRSNALRLTAEGITLLNKLKKRVVEHEKRMTRKLTPEQCKMLAALLHELF